MNFVRDNERNKKRYYQVIASIEAIALITLFYFNLNWVLLIIITPVLIIDIWSNMRCAKRQKKFIRQILINKEGLTCILVNSKEVVIPKKLALFSIQEKKFEKHNTEIEIRRKRTFKSKLIGRLHINNWSSIFEIKNELVLNGYAQIKYRPEGFWSKYGTLSADILITGTALAAGEVAEITGDINAVADLHNIKMPFREIKDSLNSHNN